MALIKCPECGKEISDKAATCPNCGYPIGSKQTEQTVSTESITEVGPVAVESGEVKAEEAQTEEKEMPNTDSMFLTPAPGKKTKWERGRASIVIAIIAAAVLVIAAILISGAVRDANEKKEAAAKREEYISNLSTIRVDMLTVGAKAEEMANLIRDVWYNTIYEESDEETNKYCIKPSKYSASETYYLDDEFNDDFNTSLAALFDDTTFKADLGLLKSRVDDVTELYGKMQNPPEDLNSCYAVLGEMYDAFMDLTGCATDPSGSLTTFSSTFSEADSDFIDCYDKLGAMIPSDTVDSSAE